MLSRFSSWVSSRTSAVAALSCRFSQKQNNQFSVAGRCPRCYSKYSRITSYFIPQPITGVTEWIDILIGLALDHMFTSRAWNQVSFPHIMWTGPGSGAEGKDAPSKLGLSYQKRKTHRKTFTNIF